MDSTDAHVKADLEQYLLGSYFQVILWEDIKEYSNNNTEYYLISAYNYFVGSWFTHNHANLKARTIKDDSSKLN